MMVEKIHERHNILWLIFFIWTRCCNIKVASTRDKAKKKRAYQNVSHKKCSFSTFYTLYSVFFSFEKGFLVVGVVIREIFYKPQINKRARIMSAKKNTKKKYKNYKKCHEKHKYLLTSVPLSILNCINIARSYSSRHTKM